jgi:hypothetical protein
VEITFLPARWYTQTSGRQIDLIVIHDMEAPETSETAEATARMFASTERKASAHYNVDNNSIVQSVRDKDVAWHAPGANSQGIGIEHAGYARQRADEWADEYSSAALKRSAALVSALCAKYGIPVVFLPASKLTTGARGITTHAEVSKAWRKTTHTDPGTNFPMDRYLDMVRGLNAPPPPAPPEGADMSNVIGALADPKVPGGAWVFADDGGVFAYNGARFHGCYPGLPASVRNDPNRRFKDPSYRDDGADGYQYRSLTNEIYRFP